MAAIMIQGCGSNVGKSVLVAGLCRLFANRGLAVRPFKPQNMSNNAAVTADGGEIGRAQALQALACRVPPTIHMNPVLLKPESDTVAQLIVRGRMAGALGGRAYGESKRSLLDIVLESYRLLQGECDLVVVEGAGSSAETNLRANDIANMGFANAADVPVILAGDIDRGHVIAQLAGAHAVLDATDRRRIRGFLVNKFRGDPQLFDEGRRDIARRTGWRDFGLIPWMEAAQRLPAEDAVVLEDARRALPSPKAIKIVVPLLSRIANFDDFDPLRAEPEVEFQFIPPGRPLPGDADLVILPGTKATIADLAFLRSQGWDIDLAAHLRRGGHLFGICGGYQMLGTRIRDPGGIEGAVGAVDGLGFLEVETNLTSRKTLKPVSGTLAGTGARFAGYEMHLGKTQGPATARPVLEFDPYRESGGATDGAQSGRVSGCYVHGLFAQGDFRAAFLARLGGRSTNADHGIAVDRALDEIAETLGRHVDVDALSGLAFCG